MHRCPDLLDFLDPQVDPGVEKSQGCQGEDPGAEEQRPVQVVGDVVLVITQPGPAHHDHGAGGQVVAALGGGGVGGAALVWDEDLLELQLEPSRNVDQNGDEDDGDDVEQHLVRQKEKQI